MSTRRPRCRTAAPWRQSGAAGRDRAQLAAHEEALRTELRGLPNEELFAWRAGLQGELQRQARLRERQLELGPMIEIVQGQHDNALARLQGSFGGSTGAAPA